MKLIIREYLASLRERGELDLILPDLLSQLGLTVYSRPGRGTRQDGVDVGAVGQLNGGPEAVYLFSIKPGDLTRTNWDGASPQSLRPSLNEIVDAYIPHRLPAQHKNKPIVICITLGGDIQEQVRPSLRGFVDECARKNIAIEEWNGDKLAALIQTALLSEDLVPKNARSYLRKSLAMLEEPDTSYSYFRELITSLLESRTRGVDDQLIAMRQMSVCLAILFSWAKGVKNTEAAYRSGELTLLYAWEIYKSHAEGRSKVAVAIKRSFLSIVETYSQISSEFVAENILKYVGVLHGVSTVIRGAGWLDVNLKLFDLLGRLAIQGAWAQWAAMQCQKRDKAKKKKFQEQANACCKAALLLVLNNPALQSPVKDEQAIDISLAALLLASDSLYHGQLLDWLNQIIARVIYAFKIHTYYPCVLTTYEQLLRHPHRGDDEYRREVTSASVLYPAIDVWAALLNDQRLYDGIAMLKESELEHCNFQYWYPDNRSEELFYTNAGSHGAVISSIPVTESKEKFLETLFAECDQTPDYANLSAVRFDWCPILLVACRHYRLPLPLALFKGIYEGQKTAQSGRPEKAGKPKTAKPQASKSKRSSTKR